MKRRVLAAAAATTLAIGAWVCLQGAESSRAATRSAASTTNAARASAPDRQDPSADTAAAARRPTAARAAKPMTATQSALMTSSPPIVPSLSIDQLGSTRERLVAQRHAPDATRAAQRAALGGRTRGHIAELTAQLATAQGADRARLEHELATFEKNDRYRSRMIPATVRASTRPGTARTTPTAPTAR